MKRGECSHRGGVAPVLSICVLAICIATQSRAAHADTTFVSGTIHFNTTWTPAGNPYIVIGGTRVDTNVVLTIQPGVLVEFNPGLVLTIDGALTAIGTMSDSIFFVAVGGAWWGITFSGSSLAALCTLEYCRIQGANGTAIACAGGSPTLMSCNICNNYGGHCCSAVMIYSGSAPRILNSTIRANQHSSGSGDVFGGGIYVESGSSPEIRGNTIDGNSISTGCYFQWCGTSWGGGICVRSDSAVIVGNTISNNAANILRGAGGGGGIAVLGCSPLIACNVVTGNSSTTGGAIYIAEGSKPVIACNTITGNTSGSVAGGVCLPGYGGQPPEPIFSLNNIHDNHNFINSVFEVYSGFGGSPLKMENTWWGTTNPGEIDLLVYDYWDDPSLRDIDFLPFSATPNADPVDSLDVVFPNGGDSLEIGSTYNLRWNPFCFTDNVKIEYSTDSGAAWHTIVSNRRNFGLHPWEVPYPPSTRCLIRVSDAVDGVPSDISDRTFSIVCPAGTDPDQDGICGGADNCPYYYNPDQIGCPCHGDPVCDSITDLRDVVETVNIAFRGKESAVDPTCPHSPGGRTDVNCTGATDVVDVVKMVDIAFRGASAAFCDPCACNPYPTGCP